jgi:hypothetical protein
MLGEIVHKKEITVVYAKMTMNFVIKKIKSNPRLQIALG